MTPPTVGALILAAQAGSRKRPRPSMAFWCALVRTIVVLVPAKEREAIAFDRGWVGSRGAPLPEERVLEAFTDRLSDGEGDATYWLNEGALRGLVVELCVALSGGDGEARQRWAGALGLGDDRGEV